MLATKVLSIYDLLSEENIRKHILPCYGLEESTIEQIKFKDTAKQRAVYKVEGDSGCFCLKKIYFTEKDLLFVYSAIEWFYRNNINVPKILPTINKQRYVNYHDFLFILTPWIYGEKCDYDITENVIASIVNLSKMHTLSTSFCPIIGSNIRVGYENTYISIHKHFKQLLTTSNLAFKNNDNFSQLFLESFDTNLKLSQTAVEIASSIDFNNLSTSLCHLDYVNKNLLFDNNNKIWVIDFDKCKIDYSVHDISYFLRRYLKRESTQWDIALTLNALENYEKIRPLNLDEYKYILSYLAFPQKFWKISRDYYNNLKTCNQSSFINLLNKCSESDVYQLKFIEDLKSHIERKFNTKMT